MELTIERLRHIIAEELSKFLPEVEIDEELKSAATAIPDPKVFLAYTFKDDKAGSGGEEFAGYHAGGTEGDPRYFYGDRGLSKTNKQSRIDDFKKFAELPEKEKIKSIYGDSQNISSRMVNRLKLDLKKLLEIWLPTLNLRNLNELVSGWWESDEGLFPGRGFQALAKDIENVKIENLGVKFLEQAKEVLFPYIPKNISKYNLQRLDTLDYRRVSTAKSFGIDIDTIIKYKDSPPYIPIPDEARYIFIRRLFKKSKALRQSSNVELYKKYYSEVLSTTMRAGFLRKLKGAFAEVKNNIHALFVPNLAFQGWLTTKSGEGISAGAKRVKILNKDDEFIETLIKDYEFLVRGQDVKVAGGKFKSVGDKEAIDRLKKSTKEYISSIPEEDTLVIILTTRGGLSAINTKFILSPWLVLHSMMDDVAANRASNTGDVDDALTDRIKDFMTHTVEGGWNKKAERDIKTMHKLSIEFQRKAEEMYRKYAPKSITRKDFLDALGKKIFNIYSFQQIGFSTMSPSDISAEVFADVTMKPLGSGKGKKYVERWRIKKDDKGNVVGKEKVQKAIEDGDNTVVVYADKITTEIRDGGRNTSLKPYPKAYQRIKSRKVEKTPTEIKVGEDDLSGLAEIRRKLYVYAKSASRSYFEALEGKAIVLMTS